MCSYFLTPENLPMWTGILKRSVCQTKASMNVLLSAVQGLDVRRHFLMCQVIITHCVAVTRVLMQLWKWKIYLSWPHHIWAVSPWASYLGTQCLGFPNYKIQIIVVTVSHGEPVRIQWDSIREARRRELGT